MRPAAGAASTGEGALWRAHLTVLQQALHLSKPDALARVRREAAKLEREVEALQGRKRLADRGGEAACCGQLAEAIAERLRRISDLAGLVRGHGGRARTDDPGATAEAAARPAALDPIEMLHGKGKLTDDQVRAAREIGWIHEAITRAGRPRVSRLSEIDPPKGWQEIPLPERAAFIHAKRFIPWAQRLQADAPATLDIVLSVAVQGMAIYPVARKHRIGWGSCVAKLADGLDRYWQTPKDGDRLPPAQSPRKEGRHGIPDRRDMVRVPAGR